MDSESEKVNSLKTFFRAMRAYMIFSAIVRAASVLVKPGSTELISSLAEDPQSLSIWIKLPMAAFHVLITSLLGFPTFGYIGISLWYAAVINTIIGWTR